ncbi:DUF2913 family protein [Photobacterium sp. ZSDE20]|nr:DUF2913 family protein [Photobacterium sp. ZSDE20]
MEKKFLLSELMMNVLLMLYIKISAGHRLKIAQKNALILSYLKAKHKDPAYKAIKKDIKSMIVNGRGKSANLEHAMNEIYDSCSNVEQQRDNADSLYKLFNRLWEGLGIATEVFHAETQTVKGKLYVLFDHLENCFEDNKQIAPVSLLGEVNGKADLDRIMTFINDDNAFDCSVYEYNQDRQQVHLILNDPNIK